MQAITTRYIGPTDFRGSRVKASCQARVLILPWDHALGIEENHDAAARALVLALGWRGGHYGAWARGALPDMSGNVYVSHGDHDDLFAVHG